MNVLILEDEPRAAQRLSRLLSEVRPEAVVVDVIDSVQMAKKRFQEGCNFSLVISDIQLSDGLSFEALDALPQHIPIIFCTAYDQYALKAFELHSVDYLLKPIESADLLRALEKLNAQRSDLNAFISDFRRISKKYKERFVVRYGDKLRFFEVQDVLCFFSEEKTTWILTKDLKRYVFDTTLEGLEVQLDPDRFFRVNRKFIVCTQALAEITTWSNSRLRLKIEGMDDELVVVARERVQEFRDWLDR
ncbi:MAG: response regulator [Cryomorphaceae bacterium]|nr:response regulator [Cryomorphaceae bacterium]